MTIELLVVLAGAWLLLAISTARAVSAYVGLVALVVVIAGPAVQAPLSLGLFIVSFFFKLIVAPVGIWEFARRNVAARNLRPALGLTLRLVLVLALALGAQSVAYMPALAAMPMAGTVAYVLLCGLALLVIHRNLLAQVIGLLVLGTGVTLAGAVWAPHLPEAVELGAAFDALIVTFIGLTIVRAFLKYNPLLDTESLRSLRG